MRKILRFLMLILMATWGAESYAECVQIKGDDVDVDDNTHSYSKGDITISSTQGKIWDNFKKKDKYVYRGTYTGATGQTIIVPIGSNFTVSCDGGYIDYILISYNNGSGGSVNHSEHWDKICVSGDETNTKTSYYHEHENSGHLTDKAWWGGYGSGSSSVTFYDTRTDYGSWRSQAQTTGMLWIYVFYHKGSTITQSMALGGSLRQFCKSDTTVTLTRSSTNTNVNNYDSNLSMYYTVDGSTPTTSSSTYGSGITLGCTRNIKVLNQARLQLAAYGGDAGSSDFTDLPDYYNAVSDVVTVETVTKYCNVTLNASGFATFAHNNNMTLKTSGYTAAGYKISNYKNGSPSALQPITPYYSPSTAGYKVIPASTAVIVFGTKNTTVKLTNPLNDVATNDDSSGAHTPSDNVLLGNTGYSSDDAASSTDDGYDYYYLMRESSSSSTYGFYWAAANGRRVSLGAHKAYFRISNTARKSGSGAKGFVFEMPDDETTGIAGVFVSGWTDSSSLDANAPMYNAAGQRVGVGYKGIVIQNGRKFIKR